MVQGKHPANSLSGWTHLHLESGMGSSLHQAILVFLPATVYPTLGRVTG